MNLGKKLVCIALTIVVAFGMMVRAEDNQELSVDSSDIWVSGAVRCGSTILSKGTFVSNKALSTVTVELIRYTTGEVKKTLTLDYSRKHSKQVPAKDIFSNMRLPMDFFDECYIISVRFISGSESVAFNKTLYVLPPQYAFLANINSNCVFSPAVQGNTVTDKKYSTIWYSTTIDDTINIVCPDKARYLVVSWLTPSSEYTIDCLSNDKTVLATYTTDNDNQVYRGTYYLPEGTVGINIWAGQGNGIAELQIYEDGDDKHQDFAPLPNKTDMLVFSAHLDDELLWFGGAIPSNIAKGKTVGVVYMTKTDWIRRNESLNAMWRCGLKYHPIYLDLKDERVVSYQSAVDLWGWDTAMKMAVEVLRKYKPEVVLTHDTNGEYGHYQHRLTADLLRKAVELAADANYDADSAAKYGTWQVKKLYLHLWTEHEVYMMWDDAVNESGLSSLDLAYAAYDCYPSQMDRYTMDKGVLYDYHRFGLAFTTVGYDTEGNDFFENIE